MNRAHRILASTSFAVALLLAAGTAFAGAREALDTFTSGLKGLDGRFTQQTHDVNGKLKEAASGRVALSAPRLFRWEYTAPYPQLIVADGKTVWVYEPDLQQVTRRAQQNNPLEALVNPSRLERDFILTETAPSDGLQWLQLTPRKEEDGGFRSARLGFDGNGLSRMMVVDALGQRTEIVFAGWKRNPGFAKGTFKYQPPKGVDVVGGS